MEQPLLIQIASMLDTWDVRAMRLTCRGWHAAAAWAVHSLQPARAHLPALATSFPELVSLDLRLAYMLETHQAEDESAHLAAWLMSVFQNLRQVGPAGHSPHSISAPLCVYTRLYAFLCTPTASVDKFPWRPGCICLGCWLPCQNGRLVPSLAGTHSCMICRLILHHAWCGKSDMACPEQLLCLLSWFTRKAVHRRSCYRYEFARTWDSGRFTSLSMTFCPSTESAAPDPADFTACTCTGRFIMHSKGVSFEAQLESLSRSMGDHWHLGIRASHINSNLVRPVSHSTRQGKIIASCLIDCLSFKGQ